MTDWYRLSPSEVAAALKTDTTVGLTDQEASRRLMAAGPNEILDRGVRGPLLVLWDQLSGVMVVMLLVSALVSASLQHYGDSLAILAIVVLNTALGFSQEYRAERAIAALRRLAAPSVRVRRSARIREIPARELVVGDVMLIEAGNGVAADARVVESANLRLQEAALTGESDSVDKSPERVDLPMAALGDRCNMVHSGTTVSGGRGVTVVTATGAQTQLGHIAEMVQRVRREPTPLQRRLEQLARKLAAAALALVGVVFLLGLLRGERIEFMLMTALSMAIAAVPEGLPAVATISLALGARQMLRRNALIRKLPAVETLGSISVICSDKTGTLTENRMTVRVLDLAGHCLELSEDPRRTATTAKAGQTKRSASGLLHLEHSQHAPPDALALLLVGGALCNDVQLEAGESTDAKPHVLGDPTEAALVAAAALFGLEKPDLDGHMPRCAELPFDSARRRMTTLHPIPCAWPALKELPALASYLAAHPSEPYIAFTKGAAEELLETSRDVWALDRPEALTDEWRERIRAAHDRLAGRGMRVLGIAFRLVGDAPEAGDLPKLEHDQTFIGLVGMLDPPRREVREAVATCRAAGVRPVMITGDHPLTALQIGRQLGIADGGQVLTGADLERMTPAELKECVESTPIFARVSPEHKLQIVRALQERGHIVAMTGDGVNDAPALRQAEIGVAMGIAGTDVSKEAADMVLLDDNFVSIVDAVREGRVIYDNIRKFIKYALTGNAGEIWVMLLGPIIGMPLPLLPLQILWINLVTDGLPGLAFAAEPADKNTMDRPPHHPSANIFGRGMGLHILWVGLVMGLVPLAAGFRPQQAGHATWQTIVFTTITLAQMGHAMAIRSERESLFGLGLFSNRPLLAAVLATVGLQAAVVYVPFLQRVFHTQSLPLCDLLLCLVLGTTVFWVVELEKLVSRVLASRRTAKTVARNAS